MIFCRHQFYGTCGYVVIKFYGTIVAYVLVVAAAKFKLDYSDYAVVYDSDEFRKYAFIDGCMIFCLE